MGQLTWKSRVPHRAAFAEHRYSNIVVPHRNRKNYNMVALEKAQACPDHLNRRHSDGATLKAGQFLPPPATAAWTSTQTAPGALA
jgi:hypothetical protein